MFLFRNYICASQNLLQIGFEGMPGAGKTTTLVSLARDIGGACLFLPEINIEEYSFSDQKEDVWKVYHRLWQERQSILRKAKDDLVVFMDRTYFTNLAFTYAFHDRDNSNEYDIQKKMIMQDLQNYPFDIIFFLDISPEIGLQRRNKQGDFPNYPWSCFSFLERFREFYYNELPKLYSGEIIYLSTEGIEREQLSELVYSEISKRFEARVRKDKVQYNTEQEESLLLDYALKHKELGTPYSQGFYVRGFPTIYFRQFAIQLVDQNVSVLDNNRLNQILGEKHESKLR